MSNLSYIGLGSNMGDSNQNIIKAIQLIAAIESVQLIQSASFYLSKAWGKTDQNDFVNTVIEIRCEITPEELLQSFQQIEVNMGRLRKEKWGPRIIDIDILTYNNQVIDKPHLKIPHPHIVERSFVLAPLHELNPKMSLPELGKLENFIDNEAIRNEVLKKYVL